MFIVLIYLHQYVYIIFYSLLFFFIFFLIWAIDNNLKFNMSKDYNFIYVFNLKVNFFKKYKYNYSISLNKYTRFLWKPIFKKNMYLNYFSENVVWY